MKAVIGALRGVLGLDTIAFEEGIGRAQKEISKFARSMDKIGGQMERVGKTMSVAITAPLVAIGAVGLRTAANFEEAMGRVAAATQATGADFDALAKKAKDIGKTTAFSASEAAGALEMLAKNGLNVRQILEGAADATVKLAAANGAELAPAADVVTDVMAQFGKQAGDLEGVVNQVTGTLIASKFGFDDYRLAIGQAGGVAGKVGVTFEDFNAALAVTSSSFASGSDAGTSFKTFLTKLSPVSSEAKEAMDSLKLSFFDSSGAMVSMEEAAARLQKAFGPLSDASRINLATKIFGTDSMRTALALATGGADAIRKMRVEIEKTSAADQAAVRMKGFNGALRTLKASIEALAIAIGESGLLEWATDLAKGLANIVQQMAALDPQILKVTTIVLGLTAAIGPLVAIGGVLVGSLGRVALMLSRVAPFLAPLMALAAPWVAIAGGVMLAVGALVLFADKIPLTSDGTITLSDAVKGLLPLLRDLKNLLSEGAGLFASLFDFSGLDTLAPELRRVWKEVTSQSLADFVRSTAKELDMIVGLFKGAYDVITTIWKTLGPALADLGQQMLEGLRKQIYEWASSINDVMNWLREKVGKDPLPMPPLAPWVNENKGAFEQAGKDIAEAWNRGFTSTFFSDRVQSAIAAARQAAFERSLPVGEDTPPPGVATKPKPGGGTGGLNTGGGGGGKSSAVEKLKEFLKEQERAIELEAMSQKQRAVSEALYKAENLAKEAGLKLTLRERDAIAENALLLEDAKLKTAEKQRLEALAKTTIEESRTAQEKYNEVLRDLNLLLQQGLITQQQYDAARRTAQENMSKESGGWSTSWQEFADAVTGAAKDASKEILKLDGDIGATLGRILQRVGEFAMEILVMQPIFDAIGKMIKGAFDGGGGGGGGIFSSLLGGLFGGGGGVSAVGGGFNPLDAMSMVGGFMPGFGGAFANGSNTISPGNWYRVNERGAEAFAPNVPGRIISNRDLREMGSGERVQVNQNINVHPDVNQNIRAQIAKMRPQIMNWGAEGALVRRAEGGSYKQRFNRP